MKKIVLANETAQAILTKIEAFKTEKNKLQLSIGLKNMGDGLACKALIVNGGMMADIGFKTAGVPKEFAEGAAPAVSNVVVSANTFVSYLKAFLDFNSNIELSQNDKGVLDMKVGTQAKVTIETATEMDALLPNEHKSAYAMIKVNTDKFLNALKVGGFLASATVDERAITDRVVFRFNDNTTTVYSTDGNIMSKAWCESTARFMEPNRCAAFLTEKLERLAESDKADFRTKLKEVSSDPSATVELAKKEGYEGGALRVALPAASVNVLRNVFSGTEFLNIMISRSQMVVNSGNVLATFALAGKTSEVYAKSVDPWELTEWSSQIVVDKEALVSALSVIRLGTAGVVGGKKAMFPFHSSSKNNSLVLKDAKKNMVTVPVIANAGDLSKINIYLDVEKVLNVLGKLANGNLVLRYYVNGRNGYPISISTGDLEGKGVSSYTYILPVNMPSDAGTSGDAGAASAEEEKNDKPKRADVETTTENAETHNAEAESVAAGETYIPELPEENFEELLAQ